MRKHQRSIATAVIGTIVGGAFLTSAPAVVAQEQSPTIAYARSTGEFEVSERNEIFVMQADGSGTRRLTDNAVEDTFPALSPDGSRIAFSRRTRGQFDLYVMNADGTGVRRLMRTGNADEVLPSWSPDGKKLAYTAAATEPEGWQSDIYRIRVADGRFRRLTYTTKAKEFAPDWAPDGSAIAFTKHNERRNRFGIAKVAPDTSGLRWLVINPQSAAGYTDFNPSWSPDSQWIAFSREHGGDAFVDIYKMRRDGSGVTAVTELNELAENPVWGSDGRILFMHNEGIAIVPAEGGDIVHVTPTATGRPFWWPDW